MSTFVWVLLLVMGVIVGNLMWLRPGPRERALAAQREHAKALGITVHLRPAPEWLALPAGERMIAHYQLMAAMPKELLGRWRWHAGLGNWQPVNHPESWLKPVPWPTPAPTGWLGLEVSPNGAVLYWREDGSPASVDRLLVCLRMDGA